MTWTPDGHVWSNADAYEAYMGRWSRPIADAALVWLALSPGLAWLDVGCGTGALTGAILDAANPGELLGVDPSVDFLTTAAEQITDPRVRFAAGDAEALPAPSGAYDVVVAGLVLHFVPDPLSAVAEMARVARSGGVVAAYVWDFLGERQFTRSFWEAATALDPDASRLDPTVQCGICHPEALAAVFENAGVREVNVEPLVVPVVFRDFEDYWRPHLLPGSSPAQRHMAAMGTSARLALRDRVHALMPMDENGAISLLGRLWAVRGSA